MKSIFVYVPSTLNMNDIGFLQGFAKTFHDNLVFYITNDKLLLEAGETIGYCSQQTPYSIDSSKYSEWLHINSITHEFTISNINSQKYDEKFTLILYDIRKFSACDITTFKLQKYGDQFNDLCSALNKPSYRAVKPRFMILHIVLMFIIEMILEIFRKGKIFCQYSSVLAHFENSVRLLRWGINSVQNSEKVSIKVWNLILSKVLDLIIGFIILYMFFEYEQKILTILNYTIEVYNFR